MGRADQIESLKKEALRLLSAKKPAGLKEKLKILFGRGTEPDLIRWPEGMLLLGLHESGCREAVRDRFMLWKDGGGEIRSPEDFLALQVFCDIGEKDYVLPAVREFLDKWPSDPEGSIIYNKNDPDGRVFADGIGMCCPLLMEADSSLSMKQLTNFCDHGISGSSENSSGGHGTDDIAGLPYHAYSLNSGKVYGPAGWGRACGWILMGVAGSYVRANEDEKVRLSEIYESLAEPVRKRVREDGLWSAFPGEDSPEGKDTAGNDTPGKDVPADTSASAMILYSEALMGRDVSRGIEAISKYVTDDGRVLSAQGECRDAGDYSDTYGSYPWSVGMTLALWSVKRN